MPEYILPIYTNTHTQFVKCIYLDDKHVLARVGENYNGKLKESKS